MKSFALLIFSMMVSLAACSTPLLNSPTIASTPSPPQVIINSPSSEMQFISGTDVIIQSTSIDAGGISAVDLLVDGQIIRSDTIPTGSSQTQFRIAQIYKATTSGSHIIVVRASNEKGIVGEASLRLTVSDTPTPTSTATATIAPSATFAPTETPTSIESTSTPEPATSTPSATSAPAQIQYRVVMTEVQASVLINQILAEMHQDDISITGVSLQNGQVTANLSVKGPLGLTFTGRIVVTVSAANCDVHATVLEAGAGPVALTADQKVSWNQAIERIIKNQIAASHSYTCVDSITIANGAMVIDYH